MTPTSINTLLRIPIFRKNDDKRYSYSTVPSEESDSDEDCLMDVISNDGSSVLWRSDDDEKKSKLARFCCCGLSIMTLALVLTAITMLLGLMLLSQVKSRFGIEKQITEIEYLVKQYYPIVRDTTPFLQYGECPATEIQWDGQLKYESISGDIYIQHSGNIAHGQLTVKQGDVEQPTINLNIRLSSSKLQSQVNVEWTTQEDNSLMIIEVPIKSGWNTKCVQLDVEVIFPRSFAEDVFLSVRSLPDHNIFVEGDNLKFRYLHFSVRNGDITFKNTEADTIIAETWNGTVSGLVTMSGALDASVINGIIDLGVDIAEQKFVNIEARAWLNGPVSLNLTSAFNGPFALDSFLATTWVENESLYPQDLQQDFYNRVGFKGDRAQGASGRVQMKSMTDDVTLRFVDNPITHSSSS